MLAATILCGGRGSRLGNETDAIPKPMVTIGGKPILHHIMDIYSRHNVTSFSLALGYKGECIRDYFLHFFPEDSFIYCKLFTSQVNSSLPDYTGWEVRMYNTGLSTATGGRLRRIDKMGGFYNSRITGQPFLLTYGDGLGDINITELLAFHKAHGKLATVTAVHPPGRFGELILDGDSVAQFQEKPHLQSGWVNGGFFVLQPEVLDLIESDDTAWEDGPLSTLSATGQLMAYKHEGFWLPMDTVGERLALERLWETGEAPWLN